MRLFSWCFRFDFFIFYKCCLWWCKFFAQLTEWYLNESEFALQSLIIVPKIFSSIQFIRTYKVVGI